MSAPAEFRWPVRVYYEDTDAAGVVYYANYLKFLERARTEWLRARGFSQSRLLAEGVVFAVSRVVVDYLRPARFDDRLEVSVRLAARRRARLTLEQEIRAEDGTGIARATVEVACVDARTFRARRIPAQVQAEIVNAD